MWKRRGNWFDPYKILWLQGLEFFRIPRNTMEVPPKSEAAAITNCHIFGPWVNTQLSKGPAPLGRKQREDRDCNAVAMVHSVKVLRISFFFPHFSPPHFCLHACASAKGSPGLQSLTVRHLFWLSTWRRSEMGWGWWLSQNITQQIINPMSGCFSMASISGLQRNAQPDFARDHSAAESWKSHCTQWGVCVGSQRGAWRGCREWMGASSWSSSGANEPRSSTGQGSSLGCCSSAK